MVVLTRTGVSILKLNLQTYILNVGQPHTRNHHELHEETARFNLVF